MNLTKEQALEQIENLKKFVENIGKPKLPELIDGHWYTPTKDNSYSNDVYVYVKRFDTLVNLRGGLWAEGSGFCDNTCSYGWKDVTYDYKLTKETKNEPN